MHFNKDNKTGVAYTPAMVKICTLLYIIDKLLFQAVDNNRIDKWRYRVCWAACWMLLFSCSIKGWWRNGCRRSRGRKAAAVGFASFHSQWTAVSRRYRLISVDVHVMYEQGGHKNRVATNLENLEYSAISLNMENSGNSRGILCNLREKL